MTKPEVRSPNRCSAFTFGKITFLVTIIEQYQCGMHLSHTCLTSAGSRKKVIKSNPQLIILTNYEAVIL